MSPSSSLPRPWLRPLCAKLVIVVSTAVALATSAPPSWDVTEQRELVVVLAEGDPRELQVIVELDGALYADVGGGTLRLTAIAERAVSDLTVTLRRSSSSLPPGSAEEEPALDFFGEQRDAGVAGDAGPDLGPAQGAESLLSASPNLEAPDRASVWSPLACVERNWQERPESCREVFLLSLSRVSRQPVDVAVHAELMLTGGKQDKPRGTLQLTLEEVAP